MTTRFQPLEVQKQRLCQPGCPLQVHCMLQSVDLRSGRLLLQLRMVNSGAQRIRSAFLRLEALGDDGTVCGHIERLAFSAEEMPPHSSFGDTHVIMLPWNTVYRLRALAELVLLEDGSRWRAPSDQTLCTNGKDCGCGLFNPVGRGICGYCGRRLLPVTE